MRGSPLRNLATSQPPARGVARADSLAELLAWLPNVERIDAHSVRFVGKDILEVVRFIVFVTNYDQTLEP